MAGNGNTGGGEPTGEQNMALFRVSKFAALFITGSELLREKSINSRQVNPMVGVNKGNLPGALGCLCMT